MRKSTAHLAALAGLAAVLGVVVPAGDEAYVRWDGRTRKRADNSVFFDWQGTTAVFTVANSTYVIAKYDTSALTAPYGTPLVRIGIFYSASMWDADPTLASSILPTASLILHPKESSYIVASGELRVAATAYKNSPASCVVSGQGRH